MVVFLINLLRVRISWGRVKNFKCVDYFQVEYFEQKHEPRILSDRISRHQTFIELEIKPCTDYTFRVCSVRKEPRSEILTLGSGLRGLAGDEGRL